MGLYPVIDGATFDELKEWWNNPTLPAWADNWRSFFDEVAYALCEQGRLGQLFLKTFIDDPNPTRRCAALYFLASPESSDNEIEQALCMAFAASSPALKTTALWGLMHLDRFLLNRTEVEQLFLHGNERLSALAMVYLSRAFPDEQIDILRAGLSSPNPRHREYACDEIVDNDLVVLMPLLRNLHNDPHPDVAQAAKSNYADETSYG